MNCLYAQLQRATSDQVAVGQLVTLRVDLAFTHDGNGPATVAAWRAAGHRRVFDPERVLFCFDHGVPAPTVAIRESQNQMRALAREQGFRVFDKGEGVVHQVVWEQVAPRRGAILVGADGHVCTAGGYGAIAWSVKPPQLAETMQSGTYQVTVPPVLLIELSGRILPPLSAKDVILWLLGQFGTSGFAGKAVVFGGDAITTASLSDRLTICNMASEGGAVTAYVPAPDEAIGEIGERYSYQAADIPFSVACPPDPGHVVPLADLIGTRVDQVIIGACSSGRLEDMAAVVQVLEQRPVHPDVTLIVVPASRPVQAELDRRGWSTLLRNQGAILVNPGCGPCPGTHLGVLSAGERVVSTTTKNVPGRIGDRAAEIFLASPLVAAAAAVHGQFAQPTTAVSQTNP